MRPPVRASARPTPDAHKHTHMYTHTNTHYFLWLGKGSYWRILSGKRTFSNKWWWTLDEKPLLAHLLFLSSQFLQQCIFFMLCVWSWTSGAKKKVSRIWMLSHKESCPPIASFLTLNENILLHVWRWESVASVCWWRLWVVFYSLGLSLHYMEAHSLQEKSILFIKPCITSDKLPFALKSVQSIVRSSFRILAKNDH